MVATSENSPKINAIRFITILLLISLQYSFADKRKSFFLNNIDSLPTANSEKEIFYNSSVLDEPIITIDDFNLNKLPSFNNSWWLPYKDKEYINGISRSTTLHNQRLVILPYCDLAKKMAIASLHTNNSTYAINAKSILLKLANTYEPVNVDVNSGLDYSASIYNAMYGYEIVYDFFSIEEKKQMKTFFTKVANAVIECNNFWIENQPGVVAFSNHEGWHNVCFAMVGFFYDDQKLIDRAIKGEKGFEKLLEYGFEDEGIWNEASLPYSFVQLESMLKIAEMAHNIGYDINLFTLTIEGKSLAQIYGDYVQLIFPNLLLPPIGDGYGRLKYLQDVEAFELIAQRTGNSNCKFISSQHEKSPYTQIERPTVNSKLWVEHGYAALRSQEGKNYWNGDGNTLFASFSNNKCHEHADGLSVMLFSKNHLWLRDSECKPSGKDSWGSVVNKKLNWTTQSHNTVMIDMESQIRTPKKLDILEFTILPDIKKIAIADLNSHLYNGVKQLRTCIVTEDYVLDVFEIKADRKHNISWITHVDGQSDSIFNSKWDKMQWQNSAPWSFLKGKSVSQENKYFWETFKNEGNYFRMDITSINPAKYIKTSYPTEATESSYIPMRLIESNSNHEVFIALYRTSSKPLTMPEIKIEKGISSNWSIDLKFDKESRKHKISQLDRYL